MNKDKHEFGVALRVLEFEDAFQDTQESEARFLSVVKEMRVAVMRTIKDRGISEIDAIRITFHGVPQPS